MNRQAAIQEWIAIKRELTVLEDRKEQLEAFLLPLCAVGQTLAADAMHVIEKRDRAVPDPKLLEQCLTPSMWRAVTKRVPVAALIKAQIVRGKLDKDLVESCNGRSRPWFTIKQ